MKNSFSSCGLESGLKVKETKVLRIKIKGKNRAMPATQERFDIAVLSVHTRPSP